MFSTSPPAACQEKTSPPRVRLHSSPPGTLASACWSRLVMLAGMHRPAPSVFSLLTLRFCFLGGKVKMHFCHFSSRVSYKCVNKSVNKGSLMFMLIFRYVHWSLIFQSFFELKNKI